MIARESQFKPRSTSSNATSQAPVVRCAIYCRKSTDEGLSQEFNSLDAQRESCLAYIASQKAQGWVALPERFDDGGFSGGNTERPALKRLLADIDAGKIDCVICYKLDRLSRSLNDFSNLMATFERHNVAFVSVTQQFASNTSMGKLTLHILMSFAQFEREVIAERTRDKIAATRRKGLYVLGKPMRRVTSHHCHDSRTNMARQFLIDPFFNSGTIHCIAPHLWLQLCKPYEAVLAKLGILTSSQSLNKDRFHQVLANQTNELPQAFLSTLSLLCDLTDSGEHIILLQEVRTAGLETPAEVSTGDLAALLIIHRRQRADELCVELQPSRRRKVRCYYAMGRSIPQMSRVSDDVVSRLESAIAKDGERKGRTNAVKIYQPSVHRGFRLIVVRGDVLHRAPVINVQTEASDSMAYHPVNQDTVTYDPRYGELRMRVSKQGDIVPYLQHIGHHVFGDAAQFPPKEEIRYFSLKPILVDQKKCMSCLDIPGIKRVVATKFRWKLPGYDEYPFEYSAPIGLEQDGRPLQQIMHFGSTASGLDVMFEMDGNRERRIRIELPNTIVFFDDDDADAIFSWLRARGFINSAEEALNGANMRLRDAG